jgi:hypothetical protein
MKKLLLIILSLVVSNTSFSQKLPLHLSHDTSKYKYPPIIVVHDNDQTTKVFTLKSFSLFDANNIQDLKVFKDDKTVKLYGNDGRYGVMDITLKGLVKLDPLGNSDYYDLNNIFTKYNIDIKNKELPVYVDSVLVTHPEKMFLWRINVQSAQINKEAGSGIEFINIITSAPERKPGTIIIRGTTASR